MSPSITLDYLEFEFVSEQLTKSLIVIAEFDKEITSLVAKKAYKEFVKEVNYARFFRKSNATTFTRR
jgi:hypothetical protein